MCLRHRPALLPRRSEPEPYSWKMHPTKAYLPRAIYTDNYLRYRGLVAAGPSHIGSPDDSVS